MADGHGCEGFEEEEVWNVVKDRKHGSLQDERSQKSSTTRVTPRDIPCGKGNGEALNQAAPLKIPDWKLSHQRHGSGSKDGCDDGVSDVDTDIDEDVPPHEWIAQKLARSQISSFSVCVGAGRTLKGRDLRKVRTDVLTRTGFIE